MSLLESLDFKEMFRDKSVRIYTALIALALCGVGLFYIYKWHNIKIQQSAQKAFSEAMDTYKQALSLELTKKDDSKSTETIWDEVELAFKTGYAQNKSSTLAPFFLVYQSVAQQKLGKEEESFNTLNQAVDQLPKNSPYSYLYKIKQSLIEIDKKDEQKGVSNLVELTNDKNNIFKDMSAFYLAEYYLSKNDSQKAKEYYAIAAQTDKESSWSKLAKLKLEKFK